jgi:hypothetical protein
VYNLIVTGDAEAWRGTRSSFPIARLGEYTAESLKERYRRLDEGAIADLLSFTTLFAYEQVHDQPARLGRVTKISRASRPDFRFEYALDEILPPVPASVLSDLDWELDINALEMNRTHWAIKDVDVLNVLMEHEIIPGASNLSTLQPKAPLAFQPRRLTVAPTVFAIPTAEPVATLVAVMMPLAAEFANVYAAIQAGASRAGFGCQRADDIWESSEIIQDVFSLIYRSGVVVVDLSGLNPNVLYEMGIAHTLGKPVVPIAGSGASLTFDVAHHRILGYLPNREGLEDLSSRLERKLRQLSKA